MHSSIPLPEIEVLSLTDSQFSPLVSKCQIKVCYVSDSPNRNRSVITKETALKIAPSLRGAMIVGHFNKETGDYEEHNRTANLEIIDGKITFTSNVTPLGFVDLRAKVWFQKFIDDDKDEREYLVTEGYLWTDQIPEARRILEQGNNQSMEFSDTGLDATWVKDKNSKQPLFIINEALISKLCVLGQDQEPCFEGASITKPNENFTFSLDNDFKKAIDSMICTVYSLQNKGDSEMDIEKENVSMPQEPPISAEEVVEEVLQPVIEEEEQAPIAEEPRPAIEEEAQPITEEEPRPAIEEEAPKAYILAEIPEYVQLQSDYALLSQQMTEFQDELASLREFKNEIERERKQAMIDGFYMLSDADKQDVVEHINEYSLDEIESKLSVICVRKRVSFSLEEEEEKDTKDTSTIQLYSLANTTIDDTLPAWVKMVTEVEKDMN